MTSKSLSEQQIKAVGRAAVANSLDLFDDAQTLLSAGRVERAYVLAVLAVEEFTKLVACRDLLREPSRDVTVADLRVALKPPRRVHVLRYEHALQFIDDVSSGSFSSAMHERFGWSVGRQLEMRERALYVEVDDSGGPITPRDVDRELISEWARVLIEVFGVFAFAMAPDPWDSIDKGADQ
jgi:AbiV family abortive infection protein